MMIGSLFSQLLCVSLLLGITCAYDCPLEECSACLPAEIREAPGVGFELTTSYGTSSVNYYNGARSDVAYIDGSPSYLDLLGRLSLSSKVPQTSLLQRYLRRLNKFLGLPATKDVGTLSELVTSLRAETEARLNLTLERVAVTTPQFPSLTREDLQDAIEHAGLKSWLEYPLPYPTMLYALNAAFAASGRGLCKEWGNLYACLEEAEDGDIPLEEVYGITFTNATLHTSISRINYAFSRDPDTHLSEPGLGLAALDSYPSASMYWTEVQKQLQTLPHAAVEQGRPISAVVLLGENAGLPEFIKVLKDALSDPWTTMVEAARRDGEETQLDVGVEEDKLQADVETIAEPLWAAARGAAMYARLRQEVPWNCMERDECHRESMGATRQGNQLFFGVDEL